MADKIEIPAPTTMRYKGRTVRLEPLGVKDTVEHAKYLRDKYVEEASKQMSAAKLPLELAKHAWDSAKKEADRIQVGTAEYAKASQTLEGLTYSLWLACLKNQPDFTLEQAGECLEENFMEAQKKANEMAGMAEPDPTKPVTA